MDIYLNGIRFLADDDGEQVSYYSYPGRVLIGRAVPCFMNTDIDLFRPGPNGESTWVRSVIQEDEPPEDVEADHRHNIKILLSTTDTGL